MFTVSEYTTDSKFGGNVTSLTFKVTDADMKLTDSKLQEMARGEIAAFKLKHSTLTGFDKLTEYNGWIAKEYRLMSYTIEGF